MAFQPAPGVMRAILEFSNNGQIMQNVLHVKSAATIGPGMCEDLADVILGWWDAEVKGQVSTGCSLTAIKVRDMGVEFGSFFDFTAGLPLAGTNASPATPGNVTAVISWGTGLTGRSTRGRTYHVGLSEAMCVGNLLESGAQSALQSAYSHLQAELQGFDPEWTLSVLSRVQGGVPLANAIAYEVVNASVDQYLDSQRRRLTGRGT